MQLSMTHLPAWQEAEPTLAIAEQSCPRGRPGNGETHPPPKLISRKLAKAQRYLHDSRSVAVLTHSKSEVKGILQASKPMGQLMN
jgi:hypothetical protein